MMMDSGQIIAEFKQATEVPVEAVREAERQREVVAPLLIDVLARAAKAPVEELMDQDGLIFLAFHLLGSWKETSAYSAVTDLLGSDGEKVEWLLGDAVTITAHRVVFNLFDGDLAPIKRLIESPDVDVYVRRRMFDLMGMLMLQGKLERDELVDYLRELHGRLEGDLEGLVWAGWAELVAQAGLRELSDLVEKSFQDRKIELEFLDRSDFDRILRDAQAGKTMRGVPREFDPFGDAVEELGDWTIRDDSEHGTEDELTFEDELALGGRGTDDLIAALNQIMPMPVSNPYRHVGRNDPCPCGSGKKFKRCCGQ
jgi:hypothetical protein